LRVRLLDEAQADLRQIYNWIADDSPASARKVAVSIRQQILGLADFPLVAPVYEEVPGCRRLVLLPYPYAAFYRVNQQVDAVEVLRVLHTARQWTAL
jgi:plasmid stabilization system protein ParE